MSSKINITGYFVLFICLTTNFALSQIIDITKPYDKRDRIFFIELKDSSRIRFDNDGAIFDSLSNSYKGRTIEFADLVFPKEKVQMSLTLNDLLSVGEILCVEENFYRYDKSDYIFVYDNQNDSIYISSLKVKKIRNSNNNVFNSIHLMKIEKLYIDISYLIERKDEVNETLPLTSSYHVDFSAGFNFIGMNLMYGVSTFTFGIGYNRFSIKDEKINGINLLGGFEIPTKNGMWHLNVGLGLFSGNMFIEKDVNISRRVYTGHDETGWASLFDHDPDHWSNVSEKSAYQISEPTTFISFPVEINYLFTLNENIAIGVSTSIILNSVKTLGGISLTLSFGKFSDGSSN